MTLSYKHVVYRDNAKSNARKPVKELTTDISFQSIREASTHFKLSQTVIVQSANNRSKFPQHPYKFEWIINTTKI